MLETVRLCLRREAHHAADPRLAFGDQQAVAVRTGPSGVPGFSAAKSLSKTKVDVYGGLRTPPARALPGHK